MSNDANNWRIVVTFKDGRSDVYSSEYSAGRPQDLVNRLNHQAQTISDADLAEIGATRDELTVASWRYANSWGTVAGFIDKYRMPGSPTGAQVVERLRGY